MGDNAKEFQATISSIIGKLFLAELARDRDALEREALKAVCPCSYYDLADTVQETPDEDLMAIVTKAVPCELCGE
jgi:redox-regulated HSP33 family molecular chaperone